MNPAKIRPLSGVLLLERLAADDTTKGGIVIPESARESTLARVVGCGPGHYIGETGRRREPMVKRGDVVLVPEWTKRALLEFRIAAQKDDPPEIAAWAGRTLAFVDEDDVSGVVEGGR